MHLTPEHQPSVEVVILIGLQASGKTTFAQRYFAATHVIISKDHFRNNRRPQRRQMQLLQEALDGHRSVVIDNTNPQPQDRAEIIATAQQHRAFVRGYFFECAFDVAVARNAGRAGKQRVPDVGLRATAKRLCKPTRSEGFDALYRVCAGVHCEFEISPLQEIEAVPGARLEPR